MTRYLVYLHSIWISQKKLNKIFKNNENYKKIWEEINYELLKKYYSDENKINEILKNFKNINISYLDKKISDLEVKIITLKDKNYPKLLKEIINKPYFLYVRWEINWYDNFFSVVWSRKISKYAKKAWEKIIKDLLNHFTIVSWWAWWCDSLAHEICVNNNKKTIVVFWTWIDITYPSTNKNLFEDVIKKWWALISIFPIWTNWSNYTFPIRNEIVASISVWCLVLQAWEKSGTLITSNLVLENSRDLFCIPWDIFDSDFVWNNFLIKSWQAKLITESQDILDEYNFKNIPKNANIIFNNKEEDIIYNILKYNLALSIDEIIEKTWLDYQKIVLSLQILELKQIVKKDLFWNYSI